MAAYSSILAWKTPWTVEPGRLLSMGSQRVMTEQLHFTLPSVIHFFFFSFLFNFITILRLLTNHHLEFFELQCEQPWCSVTNFSQL